MQHYAETGSTLMFHDIVENNTKKIMFDSERFNNPEVIGTLIPLSSLNSLCMDKDFYYTDDGLLVKGDSSSLRDDFAESNILSEQQYLMNMRLSDIHVNNTLFALTYLAESFVAKEEKLVNESSISALKILTNRFTKDLSESLSREYGVKLGTYLLKPVSTTDFSSYILSSLTENINFVTGLHDFVYLYRHFSESNNIFRFQKFNILRSLSAGFESCIKNIYEFHTSPSIKEKYSSMPLTSRNIIGLLCGYGDNSILNPIGNDFKEVLLTNAYLSQYETQADFDQNLESLLAFSGYPNLNNDLNDLCNMILLGSLIRNYTSKETSLSDSIMNNFDKISRALISIDLYMHFYAVNTNQISAV